MVGTSKQLASGNFKTQELWQWRKDPPKFSFLTGSCTYINNPEFDRPGKPYGQDSTIFETMAKEKSDFMLWLGDNWYTREIDYYSEWGLFNRPSSDRRKPFYTNLFKAMPHYAIGMIMIMVGTMAIKVILLKKPAKSISTLLGKPKLWRKQSSYLYQIYLERCGCFYVR
jgi:hypothetical protein